MIIDGFYTINIYFNGTPIVEMEKLFSFSLKESIYSIYTTGVLTIKDVSSLLQESYLLVEGSIIEMEYGVSGRAINRCKYVITHELLQKIEKQGNLVGDVEYQLKHFWYSKQKLISAAYSGRIDEIVGKIVSKYEFASTDIDMNSTGNEDIHYQPLINDVEFIDKKLLPISFSNNANGTSFYSFVTSDNVFHYRSGQSMMNGSIAGDYTYRRSSFEESSTTDNNNLILSIKRWKEDIDFFRKKSFYSVFRLDRESGDLLEEKNNIYTHGSSSDVERVPVIMEDSTTQSYIDLNYKQTLGGISEIGRQENQEGYRNFLNRTTAFVDRFICIVFFNPSLHAGKPIKLNIYTVLNNEETLSSTYSGKYLIEELEHVWNGSDRRGFTIIKVGRKYVSTIESNEVQTQKFIRR